MPSVFPANSLPTNCFLPSSTAFDIVAWSVRCPNVLTKFAPCTTPRALKTSAAITNSFTAFAFAPGVLKTGMPRSVQTATGILFTPAPALAIARTVSGNLSAPMVALRTKIASGWLNSLAIS